MNLVGFSDGLFKFVVPATELALRSAAIYIVLLIALRVFGKREVGQFTLFDLVFVLLVANAVQPAMTGPDSSLSGGLVIIATLALLNFGISYVRVRVPWFNNLVEPKSVVVGRDGAWMTEELKKQGVTVAEAEAALREHGIKDVSETSLVMLEADGSLSVVALNHARTAKKRTVRFIRHG